MYALSGEVSGTINISGFSIKLTTGGSLGSAHIGQSGHAYYDKSSDQIVVGGSSHIGFILGVKGGTEIGIPMQMIRDLGEFFH